MSDPDHRRDRRDRRHRRSCAPPTARATRRIGVGPGNVPALVDAHRRPRGCRRAHGGLQELRQLDPVHERVVRDRRGALRRRVRARAAPPRRPRARGRRRGGGAREASSPTGASDRADRQATRRRSPPAAGIRVPPKTRVLVAPFELIVPEEPLAREKLFPLLGLVRVPDVRARHRRGLRAAADRRRRPLGRDPLARPGTILAYGAAVQVLRVAVNVGRQHRLGRHRHEPRADDDDRHRVLRPLLAGREPRAAPSDQLDPGRLRQRPGRGVRRLHRPRAVVAEPPTRPPVARPGAAPARRPIAREEIRRIVLEELRELVRRDGGAAIVRSSSTSCSRRRCATSARGSAAGCRARNMAAQIIEIAPGLDIEPLTDVALKYDRGAGRHPGRRAPVRLPRVPLALDRRGARRLERRARRAGRPRRGRDPAADPGRRS